MKGYNRQRTGSIWSSSCQFRGYVIVLYKHKELYLQHQLYADDDLGPAEELESDRQQRVYRGQPSTVGQVARDRDGLRHQVTNAIPVSACNTDIARKVMSLNSILQKLY